jgi:hypothetical protein
MFLQGSKITGLILNTYKNFDKKAPVFKKLCVYK